MLRENQELDWRIFRKAIQGTLSSPERELFNTWLEKNPGNRAYFEKACRYHQEYEASETIPEPEHKPAWEEFQKFTRRKRLILLRKWTGIAACLALLLVSTLIVLNQFADRRKMLSESLPGKVISPGRSVARLTFDNGKIITLENQDTLLSLEGTETIINIDSGRVNYEEPSSGDVKYIRYNKIEIPHGGEYQITLADGTRIWLNSESTIEYQVPFAADERRIRLTGEAYFEVSRDPARPFIVQTNNMDITVLGTSFNISAYPDDSDVHTTLVNGKIGIDRIKGLEGTSFTLNPRQQLLFNKISNESMVRTVDPEIYIAWVKGSFVFEEETLAQIFHKLGRWYDIEVFFLNANLKDELFTGKLPRFEDFQIIVEMINKVSNSKIELNGNTVLVK